MSDFWPGKREEASRSSLRMSVYAALFAALIAAGAYIAIPVGPVPIVLQNLFVLMAGLLLGVRWSFIAMAVYLLAGSAGLPVFSGGTGGIGKFAGPTGGYLVGFAVAAPAVAFLSEFLKTRTRRLMTDMYAGAAGVILIYLFGIAWLNILTGMSFYQTLAVGMLPFLPGDALKVVAAAYLARTARPIMQRMETL